MYKRQEEYYEEEYYEANNFIETPSIIMPPPSPTMPTPQITLSPPIIDLTESPTLSPPLIDLTESYPKESPPNIIVDYISNIISFTYTSIFTKK